MTYPLSHERPCSPDCPRCKEPLKPRQVVEPGTEEHRVWMAQQQILEAENEIRLAERSDSRPGYWRGQAR